MSSWIWVAALAAAVLALAVAARRRSEDPYRDYRSRAGTSVASSPREPAPGDGAPGADSREADDEIRALLRDGRKIEAIKRHRELYGSGLREAKEAVERLPEASSERSPSGCAISLGLLAVPLLFVPLFSPKAFSFFSTGAGLGLAALRACPPALALLGDDADAATLGLLSMSSRSDFSGEGNGRYDFAVSGSLARGSYRFTTRKSDGEWSFESGRLRVGGADVSIPFGCGTP